MISQTPIKFSGIRQADEVQALVPQLKARLEARFNLPATGVAATEPRPVLVSNNVVQRLALLAGLSLPTPRDSAVAAALRLSSTFHDTVFSRNDFQTLYSALLKLRYGPTAIDWDTPNARDRAINYEMLRGLDHLLRADHLETWLLNTSVGLRPDAAAGQVPVVTLTIGTYEGDLPATLPLNAVEVPNTQMLIAGTTGQGKSNLLAVLIQQLRAATVESAFPVNFLLFDYKGEFSDPANRKWLSHFEVDAADCLLDPLTAPLPFSPFKNFDGKPQNAINLYATELSEAFKALDRTSISANMANNLAKAVISAYQHTAGRPVTFRLIEQHYVGQLPPKEAERTDSVRSLLQQLIRASLFRETDGADLIRRSFIIKMDAFPKEGALAKAVVYFTISKLNALYEELPVQKVGAGVVELRHFTIIDEAHYMLDFDNQPLRNLVAVGRNKGLSIILATQSLDAYQSEHFNFLTNAQYPLLMKQQTVSDRLLKDLFGVSAGAELTEIKQALSELRKGEVLVRNPNAAALGVGRRFKKIQVTHLI